MARIIIIFVAILGLSACASAPINFGKPESSSRIGMIFLIDQNPKHSNVGTTTFQNFDTPSATKTDFRSRFESRCLELLDRSGYEVRSIEPTELLVDERLDLFSYASSDVYFEQTIKSELKTLASESGFDFLIVVHPLSGPAWANSAAYIDGYGLYTACRFGNCTANALSYVSARIYDVANQSSLRSAGFRFFQNPQMPSSFTVEDPKEVDPEMIDEAAVIALDTFIALFEGMLRTSQFID